MSYLLSKPSLLSARSSLQSPKAQQRPHLAWPRRRAAPLRTPRLRASLREQSFFGSQALPAPRPNKSRCYFRHALGIRELLFSGFTRQCLPFGTTCSRFCLSPQKRKIIFEGSQTTATDILVQSLHERRKHNKQPGRRCETLSFACLVLAVLGKCSRAGKCGMAESSAKSSPPCERGFRSTAFLPSFLWQASFPHPNHPAAWVLGQQFLVWPATEAHDPSHLPCVHCCSYQILLDVLSLVHMRFYVWPPLLRAAVSIGKPSDGAVDKSALSKTIFGKLLSCAASPRKQRQQEQCY